MNYDNDLDFDVQEYQWDGLPEGEYLFTVEHVEKAEARSGNGSGWCISFAVVEGQFSGWKHRQHFYTRHANETTSRIARQDISKLSACIFGVEHKLKSFDEVIGKCFKAPLRIDKGFAKIAFPAIDSSRHPAPESPPSAYNSDKAPWA